MMKNTFVTKAVYDENNDLAIIFPGELMEALKLKHNEVLVWSIDEDGNVLIKRPKFIDNAASSN